MIIYGRTTYDKKYGKNFIPKNTVDPQPKTEPIQKVHQTENKKKNWTKQIGHGNIYARREKAPVINVNGRDTSRQSAKQRYNT